MPLRTINEAAVLIDKLNSYKGDNFWEDVVIDYDIYAQGCDDSSTTIILQNGAIIKYDEQSQIWRDDTEVMQCFYCGIPTNSVLNEQVPDVDDHEAWSELASIHKDGCEWIETRAHRLNA